MKATRKPSRAVNAIFLLLALACFAYYLANGLLIRFGQSLLWIWPAVGAALLLRWALVRRMIKTGAPSRLPRRFLKAMHAALIAAFLFFAVVEGIIFTGVFARAPGGLDYIIVLGAKVNGTQPSGALRNRIEVAAEYMLKNPDTLLIASGGQGEDEGISEAQCMLEGLTARGVDASRIILEDMSTTTKENLRFSLDKIDTAGKTIGVVTNNFHVWRAMKIARATGDFSFFAVPVATSLMSFPHYMVREFAATVVGAIIGDW